MGRLKEKRGTLSTLWLRVFLIFFVLGEPVIEEVEEEDDILGKQEGDSDINDIEAGDVGDSVQITEISEPDTPSS